MEGLVISLLITLCLVFLIYWNIDNKELRKAYKQKGELIDQCFELSRGLGSLYYARCQDFAIRWGISDGWVEMAFKTFNLEQEHNFQNWTREEFLLWFQNKREEEGLFESHFNTENDSKTAQMVNDLFK